jgi:hypothetical protein
VRLYLKKPYHRKRAGGVAQGVGLELKPQYHKKIKSQWCIPIIPALGKLKQEADKFQATLVYTVRPCFIRPKVGL